MRQDGRHRELQRLARTQWAVLLVEQIRAAGFSADQIKRLVASGILHHAYKGIYFYGTDRPPWKGVLLAAQWSCGDGAYLTCRTGLGLAKVCQVYLGRISIAVPRRSIRARQPPIHLITTGSPPTRVRTDGPLRFATVPRALLDHAGAGASEKELKSLITEAIHLSRFDHPEMRRLLDEHAGAAGIKNLRSAYGAYIPKRSSKSGLERSFDGGLRTRPHIPEPQPNIYIAAGGIRWEIDRYWPGEKVAVELHGGGYHDAEGDVEKDAFKAANLAILGIQVVVITDARWDLAQAECLDDLEAVLARRGWRRAA